jgi:alkylation response protein AidB-like acyl-CoA dehydrogenase
MTDVLTVDGVEAARCLRDLTAEEAARSEESRTLTPRTVDALWESGLMQWANPTEAGGSEPSFSEMIDTWIELAWQDGSLGWVGIANFPSAAVCADVSDLAQTRVRMGDEASLAHRSSFQRNLSHHTAMWRAARLLVIATFSEVEQAVAEGGELTLTMRADMRVAATYATEASREIVQWAHLAAGTSAIREGSRLERAFRDMYTGTQHVFISEKTYTDAAQVYLGLAADR